jgi:hypothetical protein
MVNPSGDNSIFKFCTVEYVDDTSKALRVKVRIAPYDNGKDITQEPCVENNFNGVQWCFPMLPKMMHVNPKVGEMVVVFCQEPNSPFSQRLFLGPVISQDYMFDYDYDYPPTENVRKSSARRMLTGSTADKSYTPLPNPDGDGENEGTIPEREDIALRGRGNTDIVLTDDDVRIRCGFKKTPNATVKKKLNFNDKDLAYILMRYRKGEDEVGQYNSSVSIVGDRINLLSHDSKEYFNMGDRKDLISDDEMEKILKQAHELPYGDVLVSFLKKFVDVFNRHTHPYSGLPPTLNIADVQTLDPNWDNMLSKSVKIN